MTKWKQQQYEKFLRDTKRDIAQYGQRTIGVFDDSIDLDSDFIPFIYTIGNYEHSLPELLIVGKFRPDITNYLLNVLGEIQRNRNYAFRDGELVGIQAKFPIKMMTPDLSIVKEKFTCHVGNYYETEDYEVVQALLCDKQGLYPDEPGCGFPEQIFRTIRRN